MEVYEYEKMYNFEAEYWWYKGLRLFIKRELQVLGFDLKTSRLLDAGCGTGGNFKLLKDEGYKNIFGFDLENKAIEFCHKRGFNNVIIADINYIPYKDSHFDIILCSDVFECSEVDELVAYKELLRVLKPRGCLILIAPAFQFLLSEHDLAIHSVRRYNKNKALNSFSLNNVAIKLSYHFSFLFPLIMGYRILRKLFNKEKEIKPQSDLRPLPRAVNNVLYFLVFIESKANRFISFPFGTSLMILIRKLNKNDGILEIR